MIYIYIENAKNQEVKYLVTKEFQEYFNDTPIIHVYTVPGVGLHENIETINNVNTCIT